MKTTKTLIVLTLFCAAASAQDSPSPSPMPIERAEPVFEQAASVEAKLFLPEKSMEGSLHRVGPEAHNDGMINTYYLFANDREYAIPTGIALLTRIREIYAIDKLEGMSKTDEFEKALKKSGQEKIDSVVALAKDPVGTIKRVPQGASRFFGRIGESLKGGASEGEGNALESITGVDKAKVALAVKLGVSPYSTNQELQEQLTDTARAMAGGGLVIGAALMPIGGGLGTVITGLNVNDAMQQALVSSPPSELRIINRKKLFALGMNRENADEFLMHPWYSPWQETIIVDALNTIGADPTAFLERACRALTEQDAVYFQRLAQILARYHTTKTKLKSIRVESGAVCAMDSNATLMIPLSCDYAIWSERAAGRVGEFTQFAQAHSEIKGLALWVDGKVSDTATRELKNRKIDLATGVLDQR
jgi:hypothetical protein